MEKIKVKIKMEGDETVLLPIYQTKGSVGCDLVNQGDNIRLLPLDRVYIHTGVYIALPDGYEAQVRGRSGLNKDWGLVVPVGTIDADYRGEIGVVIYNLSREERFIARGQRVAQLVISPVVQAEWEEVDHLDSTERGDKGFGSTGR